MLIDHGSQQQPFGIKGPRVKAVHLDKVRAEFVSNYPGETPDAKRKAFKRALDAALLKSLVATKEIGASLTDWIWFASTSRTNEEALAHTGQNGQDGQTLIGLSCPSGGRGGHSGHLSGLSGLSDLSLAIDTLISREAV